MDRLRKVARGPDDLRPFLLRRSAPDSTTRSVHSFFMHNSSPFQILTALVLKNRKQGGDSEAQATGTTPLLKGSGIRRVPSLCIIQVLLFSLSRHGVIYCLPAFGVLYTGAAGCLSRARSTFP